MKKCIVFIIICFSFFTTLLANSTTLLKIDRFYTKSQGENVYICAHFNNYFNEYRAKVLKPFISVTPKTDFSLNINYKEICIGNLKPSTKYRVFFSKNIPLGESAKLNRDYSKELTAPDFAPSFSFKESGYILPQKGDISIPIETINLNRLSVSLYRINSNNLIDAINSYGFVRALEYYDLDDIENEKGYKLWQKKIILKNKKNIKKTWAIDVGKYLKERKSGVYILAVTNFNEDGEPDIYNTQTQWFMISDIGLFTLEDDIGLHVYTKHLSNAKLYNKVKLKLIAKNNEVLKEKTVKDGKAVFDKALLQGRGGLKAQAIYAYGENGDFSVLDLSHPKLDLSDRGVGGRVTPKDYDAFIYSNRGIFRPGESVPFNIIVKKINQQSASGINISAKIVDSSSKEIAKTLLLTDEFGYANSEFKLAKNAKTGRYKIILYASSKKPIGTLEFLVEDFVPPKIEVKVSTKPNAVIPKEPAVIKAKVSYLTGEVLKDAEVEVQRVIHKAKNPFKNLKGYYFGKIDESFGNEYLDPLNTKSNKDGNISIDITSKESFETSLPLSMFVTLMVNEPGGRVVESNFNIFYANKDAYIGIKPNFEDDYIDLNAKPEFNIIYLQNQKPNATTLEYKLIEEEADYSWSFENGSWEYSVDYSDIKVVQKGSLDIAPSPTLLSLNKLNWGSYRLEVYKDNNIISSYRFSSGYWGDGGKHTPDKLPLSINKTTFAPDEKLKVNIKPKFSGPVMINIANYHIFKTKTVDAKEGKDLEVEFDIDKNWGSSVYVLATAFRAQSKTMGASRAIGVSHFSIVDSKKILDIELKAPKKIKSKSKLTVEVSAKKALNQKVFFTLSAVDKGVLNITKYQLPNPIKHFFGQLRLGVDIRDIYGDLIKAQGEHAVYSQGAGDMFDDSELQDANTPNYQKVVALMSKKTELINGKAKVEFSIPDYQGSLTLNAIAWSKNALGKATANVIVKDAVSAELYMPRFLAQKDKAKFTLRVSFDKDAPKGKYIFKIKGENIAIEPELYEFDYNNNSVAIKEFNAKALNSSDAKILVEILKDNKVVASRDYQLAIREPLPKSFVREFMTLKKGESIDIKEYIQDANITTLIDAAFRVSSTPLIPIKSIEQELREYPFRCAEQTTSRAFVLLNSKNPEDKTEIRDAIERLESLQKLKGGFGLWINSDANLWVSAYVMDFLTSADKKGYKISPNALIEGIKFLENSLNRWADTEAEQEANIYALYVLAKNKKIFMSDIMHFVNNTQSKVKSAMAWGQLGVTLKIVGEDKLAKEIFSRAKESLNSSYNFINYGGKLRDKAALVVLLKEAGYEKKAKSLLIDLSLNLKNRKYLSTQEMSQILRATEAINLKMDRVKIKVGNKIYSSKKPYYIKSKNLDEFKKITNVSNGDLWCDLSYIAIPSKESFNNFNNNGFIIDKKFYTLEGKEVNLQEIQQSARVVVVVSGEITDSAIKHPIITDFVPAGFELENPNISGIDNTSNLPWLKDTTAAIHKEYRDDRFSAYFSPKKEFKFAYIARAVTIGKYSLAPTKIEDMYKPRYRAFSKYIDKKVSIKKASDIKKQTIENNQSKTDTTQQELQESDYLKAATEPLGDLKRYSVYDLNYLRNGIFAYIGLDFSKTNPALFDRYSKFSWYKPTIKSGAAAYAKLNDIQKSNVQKLLSEEKKRLGGLILGDIYRVNIKQLDSKFLKRYTKEQLRVLRNSLIARYGYKFKDKKLYKIFSQFSWYKPNDKITASEIIDSKMNELQRANLMQILSVEKQK